jgi:hypothetical protein
MARPSDGVAEIDETDLDPAEFHHASRQRSARTDPSMRDGNSSHGNPQENPEEEFSADNDIGDTENDDRGRVDFLEMIPDRHGADGIDPDVEPDEDAEDDSPALMRRTEGEAPTSREGSGAVEAQPVADESQETGESGDPKPPHAEYEKLKIPGILSWAEALPPDQIREVLSYETANRNRKTLVAKLNRLLKARPSAE